MNKPLFNIEDLPDPEKNPEFWAFLTDPKYKININFLILNAIRATGDVRDLNDSQCRSQLAKLIGLQELMELPKFFENQIKTEDPLERDHGI